MKLPRSYYNYISYLGTIIAIIALCAILFFFIQLNIFNYENIYLSLYAYIITPGFLVLGLIMIPSGMYLERRKIRKGITCFRWKCY